MDPRVVREGVTAQDVESQAELALQARDVLTRARRLAIRTVEAMGREDVQDASELNRIKEALITEPIRYSRPMLIDQLRYLMSNLIVADQRPGQDAQNRFLELERAQAELERRFDVAVGAAR